jgi:hypothetical protein
MWSIDLHHKNKTLEELYEDAGYITMGAANLSVPGWGKGTPPGQGPGLSRWLDRIQLGLAGIGMIPVVGIFADLADVGISLFRGDFVDAGIGIVAAIPIPVLNQAAGAAKIARRTKRIERAIHVVRGTAGGAARGAPTLRRFVRQQEFDAIQQAIRSGDDVTLGRFFTPDAITDSRVATMQLSLPGTGANPVVGFVDVPRGALPSGYLESFGPRLTSPANGLPGGGLEVVFSESPTVQSSFLTLVPTP